MSFDFEVPEEEEEEVPKIIKRKEMEIQHWWRYNSSR
jgi:hypothetical protein